MADYQSADVASVVASHSASLSVIGSTVQEGCLLDVLGHWLSLPSRPRGVQVAAVKRGYQQASDTKAKWACTVALENKVNMSTVEIKSMKSIMHTMAEVVQAVQSMMMRNVSIGQATTGPVVMEGPKKQSRRESLIELGDSEGSSLSSTTHRPRILCKRRLAMLMCSLGLNSEYDPESDSESEAGNAASPKGARSDRQYR